MVNIKQNRVLELEVSFDKDFNGGNFMQEAFVQLKPVQVESNPTTLFLYIKYIHNCGNGTTDFDMKSEIAIGFQLTPIEEIKKEDFFKCIEMTKEHLQKTMNAIFYGHPTLTVPLIPFEDLSDTLDEHLQNLNR